ncbi:MAG TPA: PSD1 and planctomycete cytochrome C domain-containing protein [Gemmataceae bacterium]|nr:PSD1 and planctomycete cytochrome C domain-containing protein [Gemmataceae bacterium]
MMARRLFPCLFIGLVSIVAERSALAAPPTFETDIRPLFKVYCLECHGEGEKMRGSLDLRLRRLAVAGGDSGAAIVPGKPSESLLYRRVGDGKMPPGKKKLSPAEVELIARWVAAGARVERPEPQSLAKGVYIAAEDRAFWFFQSVRSPSVPHVGTPERIRNPLDAFLLARLQEHGLTFAPEADRRTLIRRATFDLHGLPPTPEEVDAFVKDSGPAAFERLIDRLLDSPRYGERWGRHWLDVAGYADSEGYTQEDSVRPYAYKYRDYVIRSLNADKPFDEFIREQTAGDEMVHPPYQNLSADDLDKLIATGFLRTAPDGTGSAGVDQTLARNQVVSDTLKIVSTSLLGLTVGCAQCHNHKYDPIPQTDYYQLRAIFEPGYDVKRWRAPAARRISLYRDTDRRQAAQIEGEAKGIDQERQKKLEQHIEATFRKQLAKLPESMREKARAAHDAPPAKRTAGQKRLLRENPNLNVTAGSLYLYDSKAAAELKALAEKAAAVRAKKPTEDFVRALTEVPNRVPATYVFHRGDPDQPRQAVAPGALTILDNLPLPAGKKAGLPTTGRRLAFARWLTDPRNPLTARVLVNRVWMHHFGRGIVGTPGDFGKLGERPTHPELLDWLTREFVRRGWRLKDLHRRIMTSSAYRQSSRRDPNAARLDPDNRLLGRMSVRRLEAEAIRDSILAVSGRLHYKMFGEPVPVRENEVGQVVVGKGKKDLARGTTVAAPLPEGEIDRRSVYVQVRRSLPLGIMEAFDAATTEPNCECRNSSTVAPQALLLMNNDFLVEQSQAFAARLAREAGNDPRGQMIRAWQLAFGVEPTTEEISGTLLFLDRQADRHRAATSKSGDPRRQALATFCQALLSSNRFLYVD